MNNPRASIYFYSGNESIELQLRDLDAAQLEHIVELSDLAGAKALNALSWAALQDIQRIDSRQEQDNE